MAGYEILFKASVFNDLQAIPNSDLKKILSRIERLANDPRPAGSQKLTGADLYRVRQGVQKRGMSLFAPICLFALFAGGPGSYRPVPSSLHLHRRRLFPRSSVTMLNEKRALS